LVVVLKPEAGIVSHEALAAAATAPLSQGLLALLTRHGARISPILQPSPGGEPSTEARLMATPPEDHLSRFHFVSAPDARLDEIKSAPASANGTPDFTGRQRY
jgi:hypothetical protein